MRRYRIERLIEKAADEKEKDRGGASSMEQTLRRTIKRSFLFTFLNVFLNSRHHVQE